LKQLAEARNFAPTRDAVAKPRLSDDVQLALSTRGWFSDRGGPRMTMDDARSDSDGAPPDDGDPFDSLLARIAEAPEVALRDDLPSGARVGAFQVLEVIGRGAFGTVYRAVHPLIGKEVAIKVLSTRHAPDPAALRRFIEEARAVSRIRHSNIVDIFDFGDLRDGTPYYVMELLRGESVAELLSRGEALPLDRVMKILTEVGSALEAVHVAGILHRDLKPANVFVSGDIDGEFTVKLLDFGIAKFLDGSAPTTSAGVLVGTPGYMSPEQCAGESLASTSDIYAFGVLSFELLTGRHPFSRGNTTRVLMQHMLEVPPRVSEVASQRPSALDAPVAAMLEKAPAKRPQSARVAVEALHRALAMAPAGGGDASRGASGLAARTRWALVLAAVSLIMAAWAVGWFAPARERPALPTASALDKATSSPSHSSSRPAAALAPSPGEAAVASDEAAAAAPPPPPTLIDTAQPQREKRAPKRARKTVSRRRELEF
jgi:eukaryotic-like serine/threonine-protein kinase